MVQWEADHAQEVVPMSVTQNKPKFIDFQALKQEIKIEDTVLFAGARVVR